MPRNAPPAIIQDLKSAGHTMCHVLKISPKNGSPFGITTSNQDVVYDDLSGDGSITYRAKRGYTNTDITTKADLSVNNAEAQGLLAQYPLDGVTIDDVNKGTYDGAAFVQYLINYAAPSHGHIEINSGTIGQIRQTDDLAVAIELRSLTQTLKQNSIIEVTSITCRAKFGDERCKMPFVWKRAIVTDVGAEADRDFTIAWMDDVSDVTILTGDGSTVTAQLKDGSSNDVTADYIIDSITVDGTATDDYTDNGDGTITLGEAPDSGVDVNWSGAVRNDLSTGYDGFKVPALVHWLSGPSTHLENEIESLDSGLGITLVIPTRVDINVGDMLKVRRDCDKSEAMCQEYGNYNNMRGEPKLPRANGTDLQAPTPSAG